MAANENNDDNTVFPGGKDRYRSLLTAAQNNEDEALQPLLDVAAEIAGLSYILDGIRYSMRQGGKS